jgi:hypothetical protein
MTTIPIHSLVIRYYEQIQIQVHLTQGLSAPSFSHRIVVFQNLLGSLLGLVPDIWICTTVKSSRISDIPHNLWNKDKLFKVAL